MAPIFHNIAVDVPLNKLFAYRSDCKIAEGSRVIVSFNRRKVVGIVWQSDIEPDYDHDKILPIIHWFEDEPPLSKTWRDLVQFTSRYYHYPIGQTVFTALPAMLRRTGAVVLPQAEVIYQVTDEGKNHKAPSTRHHLQYRLWQALNRSKVGENMAKSIHPHASKCLEKWQKEGLIEPTDADDVDYQRHSVALNAEQKAASSTVIQHLGQFAPFLLWGITGSGKTEVYFEIMAHVFAQNQQVLFLLPEINLTPQLMSRLSRRFEALKICVLHSQSADGARTQDYLKAACGQSLLILGTRLSVFTPIQNLGLIVVDEEHDTSFKQNNDLHYNARDLAIWRAQQEQCPIVLGSATPSLGSFYAVDQGRYQLLQLTERAKEGAKKPEIIIHNIKKEKKSGGLSSMALRWLSENLEQGALSMVYLNRRGFSPALVCEDCGYGFSCPHCSARLVLHRKVEQLRCHHCDYVQRLPAECPDCGSKTLYALGFGTQRVEEFLQEYFPQARIVRIDRDNLNHKNDWEQVREQINNHQVDILVGTQMLAKGHDFADLNRIVVVNADNSLYSADFRASEHLFAELMQVSGRAGRADKPGKVLIQTNLPDNPLFNYLKNQDYWAFAHHELQNRQMLAMPPVVYSAAIRADAPRLKEAMDILNQARDSVVLPDGVILYGAVEQMMVRLAARERAQLFVESTQRNSLHQTVAALNLVLQKITYGKNHLRYLIDIDPQE